MLIDRWELQAVYQRSESLGNGRKIGSGFCGAAQSAMEGRLYLLVARYLPSELRGAFGFSPSSRVETNHRLRSAVFGYRST